MVRPTSHFYNIKVDDFIVDKPQFGGRKVLSIMARKLVKKA